MGRLGLQRPHFPDDGQDVHAFYNFKYNLTIPAFTTFVRGFTALHYVRHFDGFFRFNPTILRPQERALAFMLRGFCMDFSDAQFMGLSLAYGKVYLRQVNHDVRIDTSMEFISDALHFGDQFVRKYCKGCDFHYGQAVQRMSVRMSVEKQEQEDFKNLAFRWKTAKSTADGKSILKKITTKYPQLNNWVDWLKKRAHLVIEAEMKVAKPEDIMLSNPSTDNNLESFHAKFHNIAPRTQLPVFLGVCMFYHSLGGEVPDINSGNRIWACTTTQTAG